MNKKAIGRLLQQCLTGDGDIAKQFADAWCEIAAEVEKRTAADPQWHAENPTELGVYVAQTVPRDEKTYYMRYFGNGGWGWHHSAPAAAANCPEPVLRSNHVEWLRLVVSLAPVEYSREWFLQRAEESNVVALKLAAQLPGCFHPDGSPIVASAQLP